MLASGALSLGAAGGSQAEVGLQDAQATVGGRSGPPPGRRRTAPADHPVPERPVPEPPRPKPTVPGEPDDRNAAEEPAEKQPPASGRGEPARKRDPAPPEKSALITDPGRLVGLGPDAVRTLFGKPDLIRHEPPAEIWQYARRDCVLDLFLYPDPQSLAVIYLEARSDSAQREDPRRCLVELLPDTQTPPIN